MIRWREFIEKLREDGVTLNECEQEALTEDGERITTKFFARVVKGQYLVADADFQSLAHALPRRTRRQIANLPRLPVDQ